MTTHINLGQAPRLNTPIEKAPEACDSKGLNDYSNTSNFATNQAIQQAPDAKAIATQIAKFAIAGHAVHKGQIGDFIVTKWGQTRYCKNFAELRAFALKLGVQA